MSKKQTIVGDEGISMFFSRGAMTKEGRLMIELMGQIRQKNLYVIICMPIDLLITDNTILRMCKFVGYVYESYKEINGRTVTIKGNMELYPAFKHNNYKDRLIRYLRIQRSNSMATIKKPRPWLREPGQPYGEGFKEAYYATDKEAYLKEKNSILDKYTKSMERKPVNRTIDYMLMDRLINERIESPKIAQMLNVSLKTVVNRKANFHAELVNSKRSNKAKLNHKRRKAAAKKPTKHRRPAARKR